MTALIDFAGTVAHELANIFTVVGGNITLLETDASNAQLRATIEDIQRVARRGIALSHKLQAFAGRQALRCQVTDINQVVERVVRALPPGLIRIVEVRLALAPDTLAIATDEDKLAVALLELLKNAIAAMPAGGQIEIETRRHVSSGLGAQPSCPNDAGGFAMIAITDTGTGMPEKIADRAFEPLFTTKQPGINSGWGLSSVNGFVRQTGGYMTLATKSGAGTRVEIHLPMQKARRLPSDENSPEYAQGMNARVQ